MIQCATTALAFLLARYVSFQIVTLVLAVELCVAMALYVVLSRIRPIDPARQPAAAGAVSGDAAATGAAAEDAADSYGQLADESAGDSEPSSASVPLRSMAEPE
jgi:hypothetical protein